MSGNVALSRNIKIAAVLVTSLFFLWGLSYGLLEVMNKNFQNHLGVTKANSGLLQAAYFGAYFIIAIPAAMIAKKYSYRIGIIMGLALYAIGALMIIPASNNANFSLFLLAFFILACGLGSLETNANPYMVRLGDPKGAAFRINVAQSFNGLGQFIGPIVGGQLFLSLSHGDLDANMSNVQFVYVGIALIVLTIMVIFLAIKMPDGITDDKQTQEVEKNDGKVSALLKYPHFYLGVIAQFLYVAAQVGAGAFFINYSIEHYEGLSDSKAATFLSIALVAFMCGRIFTTPLFKLFKANLILGIYSSINVILVLFLYLGMEVVSVYLLIAVFFFMSISFPTIFAISLEKLPKELVKNASSALIMSIVGGAIMPYVMGRIADNINIQTGFLALVPCFLFVAFYGFIGSKAKV